MLDKKRVADKVLLIGWGSVDWKIIDSLIEDQLLPNIARLLENGTRGELPGVDPPVPTSAWNCILTGQVPLKHNVYDMTTLVDNHIVPVTNQLRKAPTLWQILSNQGYKVHQIGAPASFPVEEINGINMTDMFVLDWNNELDLADFHPIEKKNLYKGFKVSPDQIKQSALGRFVDLKIIDQYPKIKSSIASFIAQCQTIQQSVVHLVKNEEWDQLTVIYSRMTGLIHKFMPYYLEMESEELNDLCGSIVPEAYKFMDECLGELLDSIDEKCSVLMVSQMGYLPDKLWVEKLESSYSRFEYNCPGIFIMNGVKIARKEIFFGLTNLDITPSIVSLLGCPFSKEFDGKVAVAPKFLEKLTGVVDSYHIPGKHGHEIKTDGLEKLYDRHLEDLGYEYNSRYDIQEFQNYLQARLFMGVGNQMEALSFLEDLWARHPYNFWYGARLAGCYFAVKRHDLAVEIIDSIAEIAQNVPDIQILKAQVLLGESKFRSAVKHLDLAEQNIGLLSGIYPQIADCYIKMKKPNEAARRFQKEIKTNPSFQIHLSLAMLFLQNRQIKKAIKPLEDAKAIAPYNPIPCFYLGKIFFDLARFEESAEMYEQAKKMNKDPNMGKEIQGQLVKLYRNHLKRPDKLNEMKEAYIKSVGSKGTITLVSGLPRSGTSMMMQMLVNGGLQAFTDGLREADDNNKKGYFEHEAVKSLSRDNKFLNEVGDQVIKIISHLLIYLPHAYKYKIIFMDRDIEEVMNSQHKMLGRLGKKRGEDKAHSERLMKPFKESREKAIEWCKKNKHFVELLIIPYRSAIEEPLQQAKKVNQFLGLDMDERVMAAVVDKSLYREKT